MPDVPGWLSSMPRGAALALCHGYLRRCLAEATQARCDGFDPRPWHVGARAWMRAADALQRAPA